MPIPTSLWPAIWSRAAREPLGLYLQFRNGNRARNLLQQHRPPDMRDYTIARCSDPTIILLCGPAVNPSRDHAEFAFGQVMSDLTPDLPDEEPLP